MFLCAYRQDFSSPPKAGWPVVCEGMAEEDRVRKEGDGTSCFLTPSSTFPWNVAMYLFLKLNVNQVYKAWGTFKIEEQERQAFSRFLLRGKRRGRHGRRAGGTGSERNR